MKRIIILSTIIFSLIVLSCSKNTEGLSTTDFAVEEAKAAFVNNYSAVIGTKSAEEVYYSLAGGDYTPVWEMAKANENEHIWSLEVPIISDIKVVLKNKETELITDADRRLLFIKNKVSQTVVPFIMVSTTSETKSSNNEFEHLADNSTYTGYVLYSTLAGEFVNLRRYENGVETASVSAMTEDDGHHHDCDTTCTGHHNPTIEDLIGDNEFGIMPLGMGWGDYYEGMCLLCGMPEDFCVCMEKVCEKCGELFCICLEYCDECGYMPCRCHDHICQICGKIVANCTCYTEFCDICNKSKVDCRCDKPKELLCTNCGNYHAEGKCKFVCPGCGEFLTNCKCK